MYTIDTNVLIYHANGDEDVTRFLLVQIQKDVPIYLSTITVVEFFSFAAITQEARAAFEPVFRYSHLIPLDYIISLKAAELRRNSKLKLGDSIIAATALLTNSTLLTRNIRDFKKIPNLSLQGI